jgi:hypothetical protein
MKMSSVVFSRGLAGLLVLAGTSLGAIPGAWEQFSTERNTKAWRVYDWANGKYYAPHWESTAGGEHAWLTHIGDQPLEFSASGTVAAGALVGNYGVANVAEIACEVYIENLPDFAELDCSIFTKGPDGVERWYYSIPYKRVDFTDAGWWTVRFGMDEIWSYHNGTADVSVIPDAQFLASIKEVSINFFPRVGATVNREAAIDNFTLEPKLTPPAIATTTPGNAFRMAFTPAPGLTADLRQMTTTAPFTWSDVPGETFIEGPVEHVYSTPRDASAKIFRVEVFPEYVPIVTVP